MTTVSVIVPTYNRPRSLERAIESALAQTYDDFECIVVDDGSTEDIEAVIESFTDPRLTYLAHERNRGGSAARNTGIDAAEGKYIAFLDSDDVWLPEKLEQQVACFEERSDECIGVYCLYRTTSDRSWERLRRLADTVLPDSPHATHGPEGSRELIDDLLLHNIPFGGTSTLVIRADKLREIGKFDASFRRNQDRELLMKILKVGKLACVNEPLVIRYATGLPAADAVEQSNKRFFEEFANEITRLEAKGYDVMYEYQLFLTKAFIREGRFREAATALPQLQLPIRHYLMMANYAAKHLQERLTNTAKRTTQPHSGKRR